MSLSLPRSLLDALPLGLILLDAEGKVLGVNGRAEQLTGAGSGGLAGENFFTRFASVAGMGDAAASFRSDPEAKAVFAARFPAGDPPTDARITLRRFEEGGERFGIAILQEAAVANGLQETAALRHDINNELMGLMGYVGLLDAMQGLPEEARERVRAIAERAERIRRKVSELGKIPSESVESSHTRRRG